MVPLVYGTVLQETWLVLYKSFVHILEWCFCRLSHLHEHSSLTYLTNYFMVVNHVQLLPSTSVSTETWKMSLFLVTISIVISSLLKYPGMSSLRTSYQESLNPHLEIVSSSSWIGGSTEVRFCSSSAKYSVTSIIQTGWDHAKIW